MALGKHDYRFFKDYNCSTQSLNYHYELLSHSNRQKIADLVTYIENNQNGLYGSRPLRDKIEAKMMLVYSTGAMWKDIETVIGGRFKKHGMSWTTKGANNLLKLRTL